MDTSDARRAHPSNVYCRCDDPVWVPLRIWNTAQCGVCYRPARPRVPESQEARQHHADTHPCGRHELFTAPCHCGATEVSYCVEHNLPVWQRSIFGLTGPICDCLETEHAT